MTIARENRFTIASFRYLKTYGSVPIAHLCSGTSMILKVSLSAINASVRGDGNAVRLARERQIRRIKYLSFTFALYSLIIKRDLRP
jgi:hypothetical protein